MSAKTPPVTHDIPIFRDPAGQTYIPTTVVALLLRAMAGCCRDLETDNDTTLADIAEVLEQEADTIDCRAIERAR
ncbi:hypothetical protein [Streptomyces lateritius]|uniref:hypothetical protein n=1 Tax=Streptomyces lateritius TaxID=67313 RepID=UPI001C8B4E94|nr:hypothetical protein [Streptomyces lateritius]MBX9425462.1 hypothetical protein [Streptomyces lateritius]